MNVFSSDVVKSKQLLISYDLQFFAKEGPGGEKTEPATAKKLSDARKDGNVAKSKELCNLALLFALFLSLKIFVGNLGIQLMQNFSIFYNKMPEMIKQPDGDIQLSANRAMFLLFLLRVLLSLAPFLAMAVVFSFMVEIVQVKWKPTTKPLKPKFNKLNPVNGAKRLFSKDKLVELLKSIIKIILIGYIAYTTLVSELPTLFKLYDLSLINAVQTIGNVAINLGIKISGFYVIIAVADYFYTKWKFAEDMKMTKQEVKDEYKNAEGDPQIKGKQKQRMMEASRRRMMSAVPQADVVITNPTHFAVALKYEPEMFDAPYVVAKGEDFLAARIKDLARENGVEVVENKPLARMLYYNVELGATIPPELYRTVADILAAIYNARKRA